MKLSDGVSPRKIVSWHNQYDTSIISRLGQTRIGVHHGEKRIICDEYFKKLLICCIQCLFLNFKRSKGLLVCCQHCWTTDRLKIHTKLMLRYCEISKIGNTCIYTKVTINVLSKRYLEVLANF